MPSIKELAKLAGVSASTASIVISGRSEERNISEATQKKVWDTAKKIGYQPNVTARRLRSKSEMPLLISVFWASDFRASLMTRFLYGLHEGIRETYRRCEVVIHMYQNETLMSSMDSIAMYNAVIICNASAKDLTFLESKTFPVPIVLYNRASSRFCTVNVDNNKMGELAAEIFIARGHKSACILTSHENFPGMEERVDGFQRKALSGCMSVFRIYQENSMSGGYRSGHQICAMPQKADSIFCLSDPMAVGALRAFKEAKFNIPEQAELISIGNGDRELEEYAYISLSVIHLPMEKMAKACVKMVMGLLEGRIEAPHSIELSVAYHERESCGGLTL